MPTQTDSKNPQSGAVFRKQQDLLGEREVPTDAFYGVQTPRALENFRITDISLARYPLFPLINFAISTPVPRQRSREARLRRDHSGIAPAPPSS